MARKIRYRYVSESVFYERYAPQMCGRFNQAALFSRASPTRYMMMLGEGDKVLGFTKLYYLNGTETYASYLEIANDCYGHGYGRRMFAQVFKMAASRGNTLYLSQYTRYGQAYLMPHQEALEQKYFPYLELKLKSPFD